jgi:hypothetical protein
MTEDIQAGRGRSSVYQDEGSMSIADKTVLRAQLLVDDS